MPSTSGATDTADGEQISIDRLVDELDHVLGTDIEPEYSDERRGDGRHSVAAIEKGREVLAYEPTVSVREGLERTVDDYV
jgi:UDP-glucose 4-epimerase